MILNTSRGALVDAEALLEGIKGRKIGAACLDVYEEEADIFFEDRSGSLTALMEEIPDTPIYCTANAVKSIEGQYGKRGWNFHVVKSGDSVDIGNGKKLVFVEMRMLHWPDSMTTFMTGDNILFSNDAFGQHYAVEELFNDKADQCLLWKEAMKYFANILNPFAPILTKKLAEIPVLEGKCCHTINALK